jgi:CMP-N,N'-diacetyllegionaminic acid synthase
MPQDWKRYIVDIDGTICETVDGDYDNSRPLADRIAKINALYDAGHMVVYWTARGAVSGKDWTELTYSQLRMWGCKFHELRMGKPAYDVWVDDKAQWLF